jgi:NADH-quinone oxidoreductase subunit E
MKTNTRKVAKILKKYRRKKTGLIAVLQDIQETYNWLPPEALKMVSDELSIPLIDVYSVASFYRAFSLTPRGRHVVTVCLGTACHVRGAPAVLDRLQDALGISPGCTTADQQFTLESVNCLGACALAPIVVVDGKYYGQTTVQKVKPILDTYLKKKRKTKKSTRKK